MERLSNLRWLWIANLVLLLDIISKSLVTHYLGEKTVVLFPVLSLTLVHNAGAAFGLLANASGWQTEVFMGIAVVAVVLILAWMMAMPSDRRLMPIGLSLILGGALGNLYDRVLAGVVTDFIDVHYHAFSWPVFNMADSAVSVGVALLLVGLVRNSI